MYFFIPINLFIFFIEPILLIPFLFHSLLAPLFYLIINMKFDYIILIHTALDDSKAFLINLFIAKTSIPPKNAIYFPFSNKYVYGNVVGAN